MSKLLLILVLVNGCLNKKSGLVFKNKNINVQDSRILISPNEKLSFSTLYKYILEPKCLSCHSGENAKPENDPIDFSSYKLMMIDRFVPLLKKGDALKSRLFESVDSGMMPIGEKLHPVEIEYIRNWIDACAPDLEISEIPEKCLIEEDDNNDDDW